MGGVSFFLFFLISNSVPPHPEQEGRAAVIWVASDGVFVFTLSLPPNFNHALSRRGGRQ
jgi:hypothetical protein